jgi:site-specific recombinase
MNLTFLKNSNLKNLIQFLISIRNLPTPTYNERVQLHLNRLKENTAQYHELSESLYSFLSNLFYVDSLTDAGINSNRGFFPEIKQRLKNRILPPVNQQQDVAGIIAQVFTRKSDVLALTKLSDNNWNTLLQLAKAEQLCKDLKLQVQNALVILAHRFVSLGIDPYIVKKLPKVDDYQSPFFRLNHVMSEFLEGRASKELLSANLKECEEVFTYLKNNRHVTGISLHLTFLIRRADQHIRRMEMLMDMHAAAGYEEKKIRIPKLVSTLVACEIGSNSIRNFFNENTDLLANRIANQTSGKGGKYIGFSKKENTKLLWSAMGGGLVVVFLVYIKHFIHQLHLPLLPEGILFGLNYGFGFLLMHLLHLTLATKQPAMTASFIAEQVEASVSDKGDSKKLSYMMAQIIRSQFISLIGNLIIVLPVCFISAWMLIELLDIRLFSYRESLDHVISNHPYLSGSLIFACVTGVFLTLTGIIQGYYDNKVVFSQIPERIERHPFLNKVFSKKRIKKWSVFIGKNLGAIAGSLLLGFFLGSTGNFGKFIGIPVDIRHVTISSGNFAIAFAHGYIFPKGFYVYTFGGILLIGIINIISSFVLSFYIACRSRYLHNRQISLVLLRMLRDILLHPGMFLFSKESRKDHS